MKKNTRRFALVVMILLIILGIGITLYPILSALYAESVRSEIHTDYQEAIKTIDTSEIEEARAAAEEFNRKLYAKEIDHLDPKNNGYFDLLDPMGNGIMGYVSIPKIGVTLPIFHGTSEDALKRGAGHMPESSLPVGGEDTHCVLSAHSGMASSPMFSDLELMEIGDIFQIEVLGDVLTYEVYNVPEPVLPQSIDNIQIVKGEDLCTLITCVPYGVNTHRLLVQGKRIPTPENDEGEPIIEATEPEANDGSVWLENYQKSVVIGICIAASILLFIIVFAIIRKTLRKRADDQHEE